MGRSQKKGFKKWITAIVLLKRIRKSIITYSSVVLVISLGVSTFLGINFAGLSMKKTAEQYFDQYCFHHFEISCPLGISKENFKKIRNLSGSFVCEGIYKTTAYMKAEHEEKLITVQSGTENVDCTELLSGRLPERADEVAIESVLEQEGLQIGETLTLFTENQYGGADLKETEFHIVGVIRKPEYICNYTYGRRGISSKGNGTCCYFVQVSELAFTDDFIENGFQSVLIRNSDLSEFSCFSDSYAEREKTIRKKLETAVSGLKKKDIVSSINGESIKEEWSVDGREENAGFKLLKENSDGLSNLGYSFAFVYMVVSVMVCYAAVSRMIHREKRVIGTQRALGFRSSELLKQYSLYTITAALLGCFYGCCSGIFFVEKLSLRSYVKIYFFDRYETACDLITVSAVLIAVLLMIAGSTMLACRSIIKNDITQLMKEGSDEFTGKAFWFESLGLWKKRPLFIRMIIKNILTDKRHMAATFVGIAGCTALMIIGFTLRDAMAGVREEQFTTIMQFDYSVKAESGKASYIEDVIKRSDVKQTLVFSDRLTAIRLKDGRKFVADLICTDVEKFDSFFKLTDVRAEKPVVNNSVGIYISKNSADYYDLKEGDVVEILSVDGTYKEVAVCGIVKNYISHFIVMNYGYYESIMGKEAVDNIIYLKSDDISLRKIRETLCGKDGFLSVSGKEGWTNIFDNIVDSLNSVVDILLFLSAIMALTVILNLVSMFVDEKSRVLAVMRINGYTLNETKKFIIYSNLFLAVLGIVAGIVLGCVLGIEIIKIIENETVVYNHQPSLRACVVSCILTSVYLVFVTGIAIRKIDHLELRNLNGYE